MRMRVNCNEIEKTMTASAASSAPPGQAGSSASNPRVANFGAHYAGLLRFLTRRVGCADAARDLVHDTWVRLAERGVQADNDGEHGGNEAPRDERAYLYTVAAHLASNWQRHARRGDERFAREASPDRAPSPPAMGDVAHLHAMREAVAAVERALQSLPERRRHIFLAHRLDGTPQEALAGQHGISVKTVEREVMQAMDAVHAALLQWRGDAAAATSDQPADAPADRPRRGRRKALSALLGLAGVGTASAWAVQWWRHAVTQFELALATPKARLLRQTLPDGSQITLDADSRAEVAFFADRREVRLARGSAFFDVARDADRPFSVATRLARITVLGTRFEVDSADGHLSVAVESGRVEVRAQVPPDAPKSVVLTAGQRLRMDATGRMTPELTPVGSAESSVATWRDGWLDMRGVPLGEAVQRLSRYTDAPIQVDPRVAGLDVLARVRVADAAQWLALLPQLLPVRVRRLDGGGWRIGPA